MFVTILNASFQLLQGQIVPSRRETFIDDDLIRLLCIMREGSEFEVCQSYSSNFAAFQDDKVAKAFIDIESSLKMDHLKQYESFQFYAYAQGNINKTILPTLLYFFLQFFPAMCIKF